MTKVEVGDDEGVLAEEANLLVLVAERAFLVAPFFFRCRIWLVPSKDISK